MESSPEKLATTLNRWATFVYLGVGSVLVSGTLLTASLVFAQQPEVSELQSKIIDRNQRLSELRQEIDQYQQELIEVGAEKQTLETAVQTLDLSRKKIATEIEVTRSQIDLTDSEIRELEIDIREKEILIEQNLAVIADSIRQLDELDDTTFVESVLKHDNLSDFWDEFEKVHSFQFAVHDNLLSLQDFREQLVEARDSNERKKNQLSGLRTELSGEKVVLDANRQEKATLLDITENKEENYQTLIEQKIAERDKFLAELSELESELKFILNPATIPAVGTGVLSWPLEPSLINSRCNSLTAALGNPYCITQYFGHTAFSKTQAVYRGSGHNGIDMGVPVGTKLLAALSGTVIGTGDTDAVRGCYSWGKWILIKHNNGLTTMYAHLSHISVAEGQSVQTGDVIGFSGNTGYSTGPHLHFTVYASDGVSVQTLGALQAKQGRGRTGCSAARMPTAGLEAYINPLSYL